MRSRTLLSFVFASVALGTLSASALAQTRSTEIVTKVPFEFQAGDTAVPAGSYRIVVMRADGVQKLDIRNEKGESVATLVPVTRLARRAGDSGPKSNLVFDKAKGTHSLSEVWFPGMDGFLVRATGDEHEHDVVTAKD